MRKSLKGGMFLLLILIQTPSAFACGGGPPPDCFRPAYETNLNLPDLVAKYYPKPWNQIPPRKISAFDEIDIEEAQNKFSEILNKLDIKVPNILYNDTVDEVFYGMRCLTNNQENTWRFVSVAMNNKAYHPHLATIALAREKIKYVCNDWLGNEGPKSDALAEIEKLKKEPALYDPAAYLEATLYFYLREYETANKIYEELQDRARDPWIKEAATYMVARTLLIWAQQNWDGQTYGEITGVDRSLLEKAEASYTRYRERYPRGMYYKSALEITHRIYFLMGDQERLNQAYIKNLQYYLNAGKPLAGFDKFLNEMSQYYQTSQKLFPIQHPFIIAKTLYRYVPELQDTPGTQYNPYIPQNALERLKTARVHYERYQGLYQLLRDKIRFIKNNYAGILKDYKTAGIADSPVKDMHLIVIGKSFMKAKRIEEAREVLAQVSETQRLTQTLLTKTYSRDKNPLRMLEKNTLIKDQRILGLFITGSATKEQLRSLIEGKQYSDFAKKLARETLLTRFLIQREYKEFIAAYKRYGRLETFEPVVTAVKMLNKNPKNPKGLLNLGYFIQFKGISAWGMGSYEGCFASSDSFVFEWKDMDFQPKTRTSPLEYYTEALQTFREEEHHELEAKVLNHAIRCFDPNSRSSGSYCHWFKDDLPSPEARKAWFDKLKRKYPNSKWAKLKYYW